jgi:predicted nucleic acid-binding protein
MPVIAQGELLAGIELMAVGGRKQGLEAWYRENVVPNIEILPVTPDVARHYARILAALRKAGTPIETNDIWIAAIALTNDLIVVSADQHLRYVPGLIVEDWTQSESK